MQRTQAWVEKSQVAITDDQKRRTTSKSNERYSGVKESITAGIEGLTVSNNAARALTDMKKGAKTAGDKLSHTLDALRTREGLSDARMQILKKQLADNAGKMAADAMSVGLKKYDKLATCPR